MYSPIEQLIYGSIFMTAVFYVFRAAILWNEMQARKEHRTSQCYYCKNRKGVSRPKNCTNMHCKFYR